MQNSQRKYEAKEQGGKWEEVVERVKKEIGVQSFERRCSLSHLCWIVSSVKSFSSISPGFSCSVSSRILQSNSAQAGISPTDLKTQTHSPQYHCSAGLTFMIALLPSEGKFFLPVLVDEALILSVRIDGRQSRRHLPVDPHHFIMEESGDVKILLQDLLSGSEVRKGETE